MLALPTGGWEASAAQASPPFPADWRPAGEIEHVFTHFALTLAVMRAEAPAGDQGLIWMSLEEAAQALPSVFRKALKAGIGRLL